MTWRFVCAHADVLASAAPGAGTDCSQVPTTQLDMLVLHGTHDNLVSFSQAAARRDAVIAAWNLGPAEPVAGDSMYTWTRWRNPNGTTFEFLQHDYLAAGSGASILGGHCFPGSQDMGGQPGQLFPFACAGPNGFVWGEAAMNFFIAHPRR